MATNNAAEMIPRIAIKGTLGVSGPLNSDYDALINKPQINGNELIGNKTNADLGIPIALEDLTDDSTHRVVTDEQIDAWDNKSDFSGSYNDLTDKPTIPDELADLTDDSTHRLVTDTEKTTWNAKSDFSGSYNDLTDVPANLVQDANYVHTDNNYDDTAKGKVNDLGTASTKNVPVSGDASTSEVVLGNDTRLTDDRNAKDVYSWAKASTKPSYTATEVGAIASTLKGTANGVAELDANGKVPSAQLPSYVDDVLEYASTSAFPQTGESGKIYIALDTNKTYRWGGSAYVEISESLALGETDSTAYAGNKGKQNADNIATIQGLIPSSATTSNKLATANDIPDISGKADKSEMSVSTSNDLTTIQLKSGTSATVINAHQDISGKANKSEMSVSTNGDKTTIQLKSGTSAEVLNQHQDISGKVDKVEGKGLSTNDYDDTAKSIVDGVTSALADKVDKVNGKGLSTEDYTTAEKSKLAGISTNAKKVASSSTNGHIEIDDVDTTVYDDTAVQTAINNIEDELSTDYATVEGNPINFSTKSAQNAKSTILSVEPIQDLHGYDKPWVGGAGKNLWDESQTSETSTIVYVGINVGSGTFVMNTNCPQASGAANLFLLSGNVSSGASTSNNGVWNGHPKSAVAENGYVTVASRNSNDVNPKDYQTMVFAYTEGQPTPSYEPYENLCPISGRTEIGILGWGKNLFGYGKNTVDATTTYRTNSAQRLILVESANPNSVKLRYNNGSWSRAYFQIDGIDGTQDYVISYTVAEKTVSYTPVVSKDTENSDSTKLVIIVSGGNNANVSSSDYIVLSNIQVEKGLTATDYTPYQESNDLTISLGQTVYGGQLDVEKGELVVDYTLEVYDGSEDEDWVYQSDAPFIIKNDNLPPVIVYVGQVIPNIKTNIGEVYREQSNSDANQHTISCDVSHWLYYTKLDITSVSEFKTYLASNNLQVCYELATPITINLTPHTINLLKGVNNISTDGDKITLTYRDGSVATLGDLTSAVDNLNSKIDESKILTDTVTGDKYILVVTNGVLDIQQVSN